MLTWCRISSGDHRKFTSSYAKKLEYAVNEGNCVDWAFSHVVSKEPNLETIAGIIDFANKHDFTHVRLVSDLFNPEDVNMDPIKNYLKGRDIDDSLVIYQARKNYTGGREKCLISLLKPVVGPDGSVFPCCGVQYAESEPSKDLSDSMSMGDYKDFVNRINNSDSFNGSKCAKCYYDDYNEVLDLMTDRKIDHVNFV